MANLSNLVMNFLQSQIFPFVVTFIIVGTRCGRTGIDGWSASTRLGKRAFGICDYRIGSCVYSNEYWTGYCSLVWLVKICLAVGRGFPSPTVAAKATR